MISLRQPGPICRYRAYPVLRCVHWARDRENQTQSKETRLDMEYIVSWRVVLKPIEVLPV